MGRTAHGSLFSRPSAHDRAVAQAVLERFGIARLSDRPYTMISGGERQLVLLARALAQEPQFIVLDEPTASLDFGNQGKVMNEIRALAKSGHGVLFTTHDPNHALRAADRAYLLRDGRRLNEGTVASVLQRAQLEALYEAPVQLISDQGGGDVHSFLAELRGACLLLAQSGRHLFLHCECPLSGVKRTSFPHRKCPLMTQSGHRPALTCNSEVSFSPYHSTRLSR